MEPGKGYLENTCGRTDNGSRCPGNELYPHAGSHEAGLADPVRHRCLHNHVLGIEDRHFCVCSETAP